MRDGRDAPPPAPGPAASRPGRAELVALALLTALALALRLWRLDALPGGPHVDEAWNWLDARRVLEGWRPLFLPDNAGREVLYTYLQAALLGLFGDRLGVLRAASALAATALVPLAWATARALAPRGLPRSWVGLPAAGLAAGSYWSLHFGRFGIRAITFPLFVGAVAWLWLRAVETAAAPSTTVKGRIEEARSGGPAGDAAHPRRGPAGSPATWLRRHRWTLLCGLALGLSVYSHPAGRGLVLLPALHALWLAWRRWRGTGTAESDGPETSDPSPSPWRPLAVTVATALLVALPVNAWWAAHPGFFLGHADEVSILSGGLGALWANVGKVLGMFHLAGDPARWRNLPGRPVFDPLTGLLFLGGLALALRAAWHGERGPALALAWLAVLLAPTILADQAPNFSRAIGVLPIVWLFPAWALAWVTGGVARILGGGDGMDAPGEGTVAREGGAGARGDGTGMVGSRLAQGATAAVLALVPLQAGEAAVRDYFVDWATHPETPIAFDDDLADLGRLAGEIWAQGGAAYLSPEMAAHPTVRVASPVFVPGVDTARGFAVRERSSEGGSTASATDDPGGGGNSEIASSRYLYVSRVGTEVSHHSGSYGWGNVTTATGDAISVLQQDLPERGISGRLALLDPRNLIVPLRPIRFGPLELVHAAIAPLNPRGTEVTLGWRADGPTDASLTQTVRLVDETGETIAQHDGLPLGPGHPTNRWREGEVVLVRSQMEIREDRQPWRDDATVLVGWYALTLPERDGDPPRTEDLFGNNGAALAEVGPALFIDFGDTSDEHWENEGTSTP